MKKIFLFGFITLLTLSQAKMVDGIALVVEGEAVTTSEIRTLQRQLNTSKEKAIDILIQDRLQKVAMRDIDISEDQVDERIAKIVATNNLSVSKMQTVVKQSGTTWSKYRSIIKDSMKKQKFFEIKVISTIPNPSDSELKSFYGQHKQEFTIPSTISAIEYSADDERAMQKFLKTKTTEGIKSRSITKKTSALDPTLLTLLLQTKNGSYSSPFKDGKKFLVFKIKSKNGSSVMPFESAKKGVLAGWKQQQQNKALKNYFEKMKADADIQTLR